MLDKAYEPKKYEDDIYKRWEESGFFNPDVCVEKGLTKADAQPFSIVLPPPNVTGTLHMGHAAMLAIEDMMVRYHRMKGDRTLWVPGTDHASIATESKVEGLLIKNEGFTKPKEELGREKFLERVKQFAQDSHDTIINQSKKMGSSLDWSREAYTLDDERNLAVRTVFKQMYEDGLIYRGNRIVNWDPVMQSNVSDEEMEWKEEKAPFYYFKYGPFEIGTVRPETKFGDKYIVMHPEDERYKDYTHGQQISLEWINGPIVATIIKDESVDPEFGSGVMTITPWHSTVDFEIAQRHKLDAEQIIDYDGKLLPIAGEFAGMDAVSARKAIIAKLEKKGLLARVEENYVHNVAINYRGGKMIEPQIRKQWFIDVNKPMTGRGLFAGRELSLKEMMQEVVRNNNIEIVPDRFNKTYFHWIDNLRDWCISRQIWFGHQIPVWYRQISQRPHGRVGGPFRNAGEEIYCGINPPEGTGWTQDPDTLDTWFSSGLWTFSTLGWPNKTEDFKRYHPTSVLETGYDILFFWVARMILMTTYTLGEVPFKTVYLHGLVRDEHGRKMSKSLGNIINPLDMIAKFGTDATRLSLLLGSTPGNDVKLSEEKIAGFRNFTNKLWNISRFVIGGLKIDVKNWEVNKIPTPKTLADRWILARLQETIDSVSENIEKNNFSFAGETLREFTWTSFADWYLEIAKIEGGKDEVLLYVLTNLLKLWHPYMPFVTEAIWQEMFGAEKMLMVEKWPTTIKSESVTEFSLLQNIVVGIRALRNENKIEPAKMIKVLISAGNQKELLTENILVLKGLVRAEEMVIENTVEKPGTAVGFVETGVQVYVDMAGLVDKEKEKARLEKEIATVAPYVESMTKKLSNQEFVNNAPPAVIDGERKKLAEAEAKLAALTEQLNSLT